MQRGELIYRGYTIFHDDTFSESVRWRCVSNGELVWSGDSEGEALKFVDRTKRAQKAARDATGT